MTGIFSTWQPIYAQRGIATFPVGDAKKPCIRGWQRVGLGGSAELAAKFQHADAFGYLTGLRIEGAIRIVRPHRQGPQMASDRRSAMAARLRGAFSTAPAVLARGCASTRLGRTGA
jgi:hypothetical protein